MGWALLRNDSVTERHFDCQRDRLRPKCLSVGRSAESVSSPAKGRWTNRDTANRRVRTHMRVDTHTNSKEDVWYVCWFGEGGGGWQRRLDTSSESLGEETGDLTTGLFIDRGEVETDHLCSTGPLRQFGSALVTVQVLFSIQPASRIEIDKFNSAYLRSGSKRSNSYK